MAPAASTTKPSQLAPMQRHRQQHRERAVWNDALLKLRQNHSQLQHQHDKQLDETTATAHSLPAGELSAILSNVHRNISYPNRGISTQECGVMVSLLCQALLPYPANTHEALACELSEYITSLTHKRSLDLDHRQLQVVLTFFLATIPHCSSFFVTDHLKALSFVLFENGDRCSELLEQLVRTCLVNERITGPTAMNLDAKQQAFTCIGNVLAKAPAPNTRPFLPVMFDCALHAFTQYAGSAPDGHAALDTSKVLSASLRVVRAVAASCGPGDFSAAASSAASLTTDQGQTITINLAKHVPTLVHRLSGLFTYGLDLSAPPPVTPMAAAALATKTAPARASVPPPSTPPSLRNGSAEQSSINQRLQPTRLPPTTPDKPKTKPLFTTPVRPWRPSRSRKIDTTGGLTQISLAQLSESEFSDTGGAAGYASAPLTPHGHRIAKGDVSHDSTLRHHHQCMPGSSRLRNNFAKVRAGSLDLVQVLARVAPKAMQSHWTLLLPQRDSTCRVPSRPHLLTAMLYDPLPTIRASASMAVAALMEHGSLPKWLGTLSSSSSVSMGGRVVAGSKTNSTVESRRTAGGGGVGAGMTRGFVSASERVAMAVVQVHSALSVALNCEVHDATLCQILHCSAVLVQQTPYNALYGRRQRATRGGLSSSGGGAGFNAVLRRLLDVPSATVRSAAISCVAAVLNTAQPIPEINAWLFEEPCLLEHVVKQAARQDSPVLVRTGALTLIAHTLRLYAAGVGPWWEGVYGVLLLGFRDADQGIRLGATKVVEEIVKDPARLMIATAKTISSIGGGAAAAGGVLPHWETIVSVHLPRALRDTFHAVRVSAALCLSQLRPQDWDLVTQVDDAFIQGILNSSRDPVSSVRSAAIKVLASVALVPSFRTPHFVRLAVPVLMHAMQDDQLQLRTRAAIAIANLTFTPVPVVVKHVTDDNDDCETHVPAFCCTSQPVRGQEQEANTAGNSTSETALCPGPELATYMNTETQIALLTYMLDHCEDHDKVACACVRAVGYLSHWLALHVAGFVVVNECMNAETSTSTSTFASVASTGVELETNNGTHLQLLNRSVAVLIRKVQQGNAKVNWSACHSLGFLISGGCVPISWTSGRYPTDVYGPSCAVVADFAHHAPVWPMLDALMKALTNATNFKVRLAAAGAFLCVQNRHHVGTDAQMVDVVRTITGGLLRARALTRDALARTTQEQTYVEGLQEKLAVGCAQVLGLMCPQEQSRVLRWSFEEQKEMAGMVPIGLGSLEGVSLWLGQRGYESLKSHVDLALAGATA